MLLGWRIGFVFFGIISIAVGVLFYSTNVPKAHEKREPTKILDFVKEKKMPVLLCYVVLGGLSLQDVTFFFPTFLTVERMISRDVAAYASSALLLVGAVGQFAAGAMSGRYGSKKSPS
jgi:predicted MFS family arabinose efflux permease